MKEFGSLDSRLLDRFLLQSHSEGIDTCPDVDSLQREEFHRNGEDYRSCKE